MLLESPKRCLKFLNPKNGTGIHNCKLIPETQCRGECVKTENHKPKPNHWRHQDNLKTPRIPNHFRTSYFWKSRYVKIRKNIRNVRVHMSSECCELQFWHFKISKHKRYGLRCFDNFGPWKLNNFAKREFVWNLYLLKMLEPWNFETLELWKFENLKLCIE